MKLLQAPLTGLPEGLGARPGLAESALSEHGIAVQAFAVEARLLAQPVSFELVSTTQAEGIEDRMTMAPLAARRLAEMVELGARVVSVELLLAAQACDLRGPRLGVGTARGATASARVVPFSARATSLPDLEPLVALVRSGELGADDGGFDVHQHLWPAAFVEALRRAPSLRSSRATARARRGAFASTSRITTSETAALLDRDEIETAVVSLQPTLGLDALEPSERAELVAAWEEGILELVPRRRDGGRAARRRPAAEGFAGVSIGADRLDELDALASTLDGLAAAASSSCTRSRATRRPEHRPGGRQSSTTRARCSGPTSPG